ncbi:conserved hypothetical protein [Ahrensia sp. R2A130]|nr:conserved hypothetical protein [Ahrensia sp. R2A130]
MTPDKELLEMLKVAKPATDSELAEQRISFAFGNAPDSDLITKESVRQASRTTRLR